MKKQIDDVICSCAITASLDLDVCLIIVFTRTGRTAVTVSKYRPRAPVLALTRSEAVAMYCSLGYGILPYVARSADPEEQLKE